MSVVLNTSFNLCGEPIVNTLGNAFRTYVASEVGVFVVGNFLLIKKTKADDLRTVRQPPSFRKPLSFEFFSPSW